MPKRPPKREYSKSGLYAVQRRLEAGEGLDPSTPLGQAVREWRDGIVVDLGGADAISTQQTMLIDAAVQTKVLLDTVDAYIATMGSPVNRQKRQLFAVVMQRMTIADSLGRALERLGLERRARTLEPETILARFQKPGSTR